MAETKYNLEEIKKCAVDMRKYSGDLKNIINEIHRLMQEVESIYKTSSSDEMMKKYKDMEKKSQEYIKGLTTYSEFLEKTHGILNDVEKKIAEAAAQEMAQIISGRTEQAISDLFK